MINTGPTFPMKLGSLTAPVNAAMAAMNTLTFHLIYLYTGFEGVVPSARGSSQPAIDISTQHFPFGKSPEDTLPDSDASTQHSLFGKLPEANVATIACPQLQSPPQQSLFPPPPQRLHLQPSNLFPFRLPHQLHSPSTPQKQHHGNDIQGHNPVCKPPTHPSSKIRTKDNLGCKPPGTPLSYATDMGSGDVCSLLKTMGLLISRGLRWVSHSTDSMPLLYTSMA